MYAGAMIASTMFLATTTGFAQTDLSSINLEGFESRTLQVPLVGPASLQGLLIGPHIEYSSLGAHSFLGGADGLAGLSESFGHGGPQGIDFERVNGLTVLGIVGQATATIDPEWAYSLIERMESED